MRQRIFENGSLFYRFFWQMDAIFFLLYTDIKVPQLTFNFRGLLDVAYHSGSDDLLYLKM